MSAVSEDASPPEPDRLDGAPHPRDTVRLVGQQAAEEMFLQTFNTGRLHHGWLITGPRGIGKATLAWRIARFLLTHPEAGTADGLFGAPAPPETLDVDPEHPVARRVRARSEPRLFHICRSPSLTTGRLRDQIVAEDVRGLAAFFSLRATEGGRRVVLIDAADDLNVHAANALLKMLEEPPAGAVLLLVSHQPGRLLPTIRSRCRALPLAPLSASDLATALTQAGYDPGRESAALGALAQGSVGTAIGLLGQDGTKLYAEIVALAGTLPALDRARAVKLSSTLAVRGAEAQLDLMFDLIELFLARLARAGAGGAVPAEAVSGEADVLARLAPSADSARAWAACAQEIAARARHGRAVNLDPATLVLDTVFQLQRTAQAV
ncbi:MAG: DNA polymerase III subunit delta' [Pseudomonadota bacterium]